MYQNKCQDGKIVWEKNLSVYVINCKFTSGATAQELLGCFDDTINYDQFLVVTAEGTSLEERLKILLHLNCIRGKEKKTPKKSKVHCR